MTLGRHAIVSTLFLLGLTNTAGAQTVDLSLNLQYTNPANPALGGAWTLVAKTDSANGIASIHAILSNINAGAITAQAGIGAVLSGGSPFVNNNISSVEVLYFQDLSSPASVVTNVGGGAGTPGNLALDPLNDPLWNNSARIFSGSFGAMAPAFTTNADSPPDVTDANVLSTGVPPYFMASAASITTIVRDNLSNLLGDYNLNGTVDAADYVVWRKNPSAHGGDPAGYNTWRTNFGSTLGAGSGLGGGTAVPEPATWTIVVALVGVGALLPRKWRIRFHGAGAILLVFVCGIASAANITWIGGNADWVDAGATANWNPADEPDFDDTAIFNTANSVDLGSNNTILALTMSGSIDVNTNNFDLVVNGLVQLTGASTNLFVGGTDSLLTADSIAINSGANVELNGGTIQINEEAGNGILDINAGGELIGHGTLSMTDAVAANTTLIVNDGAITARRAPLVLFGAPQIGTLTLGATDVDTCIDLDGVSETGVVNVTRNQTLDLNIQMSDAFSGTINLFQNATLNVSNAWGLNTGTINADNGFVDNPAPNPDIPAGISTIGGATFTQSGGTINVVDTDGTLVLPARFTMTGGTFNNQGHTIFNGITNIETTATFNMGPSGSDLTIGPNGIASIDQNSFNLDGTSAGTVITVGSNAELNLNLGDYDNDSATNSFDATITLHSGGISVTTTDAEFVMNGVLNMDNTTGAAPTWSGEPLDIGNDLGALSADLNVTGKGNSDFTAAVDFNSDADVSVSAESSLRLRSSVNFDTVNGANNAEFTGAGTISFSGAVNVNEAATLNMVGGTVDLDGVDTVGDFINVDAPFTINAANMSSFGKVNVGGTNTLDINNSVGAGVLTVNLDDANDDWTLNAAGVMNLVNDNNAATLLAGSDINLNGTVNVTGDVRVTARVDIGAGSVNIGTAGQPLRLSGGDTTDTNTIAGATVAGAGQLGADTGHALHGFGTINSDILFEGGSNLRASGGTLTINGTILAVNLLGTADDTGVLNIVDPWFTSGAPSGNIGAVVLNGGVLQGGQITNDDSTGLQGHGTITSRVINNTQIVAANGGSLVMQTASNDNDWDGAANTGDLIAVSANLELRDTATFGFAGTVSADNGLEVFANGFALDFNPGSTLSLEEGARYRSTNSTVIGGTVTVGAGAASTIEVPTNFVLTFETGSTTTLTGNLRLVNNFINIEAGAAFSGSGAVVIPDESGIVADNLADIGVLLDMQGTFRPGGSEGIGRIDLLDYQSSDTSELFVELTGTALNRFDRLVAEGDVIVDGYLNIDIDPVSPGVPFVPVLGQTFNIITANSVTGEFDLADISGMPNGLTFHIEYLPNAVQLQVVSTPFFSADFDNDGDVDGTDLIIWRGAFDLNQLGDADGDNDTDGADLLIWQRQFGSTAGAGAGATASVPEPGTLVLLLLALLTATPNRRRTDAESYCQGRPHRRQLGRLVGNDNRSRHHVSGALAAARRERNDPHRRQLVEERRHNHRARRDSRGLAMRLW